MTKAENLLIVAAEECAEISQAISKAIRFGLSNHNPLETCATSNENNIWVEFYQLQAVFEMLVERGIITKPSDNDVANIIANKKSKVAKYEALSEELGHVTKEAEL